ncbi:hypothetical protein EVAR_53675_1 [Eumeta japonica]|uniref:Uncharacterized protein n=1 Tax=Eumeta variegata TaxID=151549 RepID=A0A4C1YPH7_EUMVA|nr:hypothetical protein EVAR_53675_1 [Eumeta japonica]
MIEPHCGQEQHINEPAGPVKYDTLTGNGREEAAFDVEYPTPYQEPGYASAINMGLQVSLEGRVHPNSNGSPASCPSC